MQTLKQELIECINTIPDDKLENIKPLLYMLSNESFVLEKISEDDLSEDELAAVLKGRKEYENGNCIDFEDYLQSRELEAHM